jgi:hypothetical protein
LCQPEASPLPRGSVRNCQSRSRSNRVVASTGIENSNKTMECNPIGFMNPRTANKLGHALAMTWHTADVPSRHIKAAHSQRRGFNSTDCASNGYCIPLTGHPTGPSQASRNLIRKNTNVNPPKVGSWAPIGTVWLAAGGAGWGGPSNANSMVYKHFKPISRRAG